MGYAISHDWSEYNENWENHGRSILRDSCKHKGGVQEKDYCEKCDISEDSCEPMMNYIYPLELTDFEDKKVLEVVKNTNCTLMENTETGEYFLTLCGGGMDLSQDIGYAYIILEKWIPRDLLTSISKQPLLSLGSKKYKRLAKEVISQLKHTRVNFLDTEKRWKESLKNFKAQEKAKEVKE